MHNSIIPSSAALFYSADGHFFRTPVFGMSDKTNADAVCFLVADSTFLPYLNRLVFCSSTANHILNHRVPPHPFVLTYTHSTNRPKNIPGTNTKPIYYETHGIMGGFTGVTGFTVTMILFATGSFHMIGEPSTWVREDSSGNVVATYTEYDRDDWSVYVSDKNGADLLLDTWTKKVYYLGSSSDNALYSMEKAFAITGYGLTYITYKDFADREGKIIQVWGEKTWQWTQPGERNPLILTEYKRDQWSVYLNDKFSRKLQIDYHTKEFIVRGSDYIGKYEITDAKGYRYRS